MTRVYVCIPARCPSSPVDHWRHVEARHLHRGCLHKHTQVTHTHSTRTRTHKHTCTNTHIVNNMSTQYDTLYRCIACVHHARLNRTQIEIISHLKYLAMACARTHVCEVCISHPYNDDSQG